MIPRRHAWPLLAAACFGATDARADDADDAPTVTPYRPTVSNPADLSAPGWLELEAGAARMQDVDGFRTDGAPFLLKYAFDSDHGVLVGGNLWTRLTPRHGRSTSGLGDTTLEWKQRFGVSDGVAFGVEAGVQLPTAHAALGNGKPAYVVNGIFSTDLGTTHLDLIAGGTRFTRTAAHASAWQSAWAAAVSHPLGAAFGVAAEISGTAQRAVGHAHQALAAINYNVSRRCVLDTGIAYVPDRGEHSHELFFGGTWLLGKVR